MWKAEAIQGLLVVALAATSLMAQDPAEPQRGAADSVLLGGSSSAHDLIERLPPTNVPPDSFQRQAVGEVLSGGEYAPAETLEQAWACALALEPLVEADRFSVAAAEDNLRAAKAERMPDAGLNVGYIVRDNMPALRLDIDGLPFPLDVSRLPTNQREALTFGTVVNLPLFTSGRIGSGIDAATSQLNAAKLQVQSTSMDLKIRVAVAYAAVLRAQRNLAVTESRIRSLEAHVHDLSLLLQHQQVSQNDLLAARVQLANARQDELRVIHALDMAQAEYNRLLQRPFESPVQLADLSRPLLTEDLVAVTQRAVALRPVLGKLAAQMRALQEQADAVRAARKPQFDLLGQYLFEENRFRTPEGIASLAVGMHWNAIDGGRGRHEANALMQEAARLGRIRADAESEIRLEVRRAWLDVQEADHRIEIIREALAHAAENLRVARSGRQQVPAPAPRSSMP